MVPHEGHREAVQTFMGSVGDASVSSAGRRGYWQIQSRILFRIGVTAFLEFLDDASLPLVGGKLKKRVPNQGRPGPCAAGQIADCPSTVSRTHITSRRRAPNHSPLQPYPQREGVPTTFDSH